MQKRRKKLKAYLYGVFILIDAGRRAQGTGHRAQGAGRKVQYETILPFSRVILLFANFAANGS